MKTERINKYIYGWAIWSNYGYDWEKESSYDNKESTYKQVKADLKEYRFACPNASYKIKENRELNPKYKAL